MRSDTSFVKIYNIFVYVLLMSRVWPLPPRPARTYKVCTVTLFSSAQTDQCKLQRGLTPSSFLSYITNAQQEPTAECTSGVKRQFLDLSFKFLFNMHCLAQIDHEYIDIGFWNIWHHLTCSFRGHTQISWTVERERVTLIVHISHQLHRLLSVPCIVFLRKSIH